MKPIEDHQARVSTPRHLVRNMQKNTLYYTLCDTVKQIQIILESDVVS